MAKNPIGEFDRIYPDNFTMHSNKGRETPLSIGMHAHTFGHLRILYCSDAPGPDGRVGWWELAESPIRNDAGEITGWHEEKNEHVRANGPDSARWIPAGWRHHFTLLSMTGYHECYYHFRNADDEITTVYEGFPHGAG